jgi:hypothetical protein
LSGKLPIRAIVTVSVFAQAGTIRLSLMRLRTENRERTAERRVRRVSNREAVVDASRLRDKG